MHGKIDKIFLKNMKLVNDFDQITEIYTKLTAENKLFTLILQA